MKLCSIVGARPQFVKLGAVYRAGGAGLEHCVIHTGQHYDAQLSDVFFDELRIPAPKYSLNVGSGSHAVQTSEMMRLLEPALEIEQPDCVLLYGDTNSTLAGALVAAKMHLRTAHVEAGLRSFNRRMPEENNRVVTDHLSDLLLCPTEQAVANLAAENLADRAVLTGDVMYDAVLAALAERESSGPLADRWLPGEFALATIHRAENTEDPARMLEIVEALDVISRDVCPAVFPIHPRTRKCLRELGWEPRWLTFIPPVSYFEMLMLESRARMILTDSGGVQKEAYFLKVPCITLRDETEWVETLAHDCNVLTGASREKILQAVANIDRAGPWLAAYGDGHASEAILRAIEQDIHGERASVAESFTGIGIS